LDQLGCHQKWRDRNTWLESELAGRIAAENLNFIGHFEQFGIISRDLSLACPKALGCHPAVEDAKLVE